MTWRDYKEGHIFIIPEGDGIGHLGVIARKDATGLLGYFFGRVELDRISSVELCAEKAILIAQFSGLGFEKGEWKLLHKLPHWDKIQWPVPKFANREPIMGWPRAEVWRDDIKDFKFEYITEEEFSALPKSGMHGWISMQNRLFELPR